MVKINPKFSRPTLISFQADQILNSHFRALLEVGHAKIKN
jgi:hypothetical protein